MSLVSGFVFQIMGYAFTVLNDFMPKKTMEEVSNAAEDVRLRLFASDAAETERRAQAALATARSTSQVLSQSGASPEVVARMREHAAAIEEILTPVPIYQDVLAGSLSATVGPKTPGWVKAAEHPGTLSYFTDTVRRSVGGLFEDAEARERATQLMTQVQVHRRQLRAQRAQLAVQDSATATAQRAKVDETLKVLDFVLGTMAQSAPSGKPASPPPSSNREEVPIG